MNRASKLFLSLIFLSFAYNLEAIDSDKRDVSLPQWPAFIYYEPFPSVLAHSEDIVRDLPKIRAQACEMTRIKADYLKIDEPQRVALDWVYALHQIEKELLRKPIETYTIEDISLISSWFTRLTAKNPGALRRKRAMWKLKDTFTPEETQKIQAILAKPEDTVSADEHSFIKTCYLYFTPAQNIEPSLHSLLESLKRIEAGFQASKQQNGTERIAAYLDIAAYIHLTIVDIHGYEEGSKRLGRAMMFIYLAQHGIEPLTFYLGNVYPDMLAATLTGKDRDAFKKYVWDTYMTNKKMRPDPHYFFIAQNVGQQVSQGLIAPEKFHEALLNHPLHRKWDSEQSELSKRSSKIHDA